ncbi:uncharacterized protein STEHIDRAFT_153936 [Stereum hirsutum FP-91666 SS1]|uniref:uncharacterized protein n=1 Tax=Stereum hirsutum (strain FP-91666) TaxID=721885 RepID=UPI000440C459|nr:uncharacterized protein STEHIDRAFT_153936 [Stereum hirsutum FP-91666 SS1]EIM90102.1 hypothetical protein STEHIDRAFT_153936 [Stereum hirsutum FP-91666 SS1]
MTDAIEMDELNRRRPPVHPDLATERNQQPFDDDTKDSTLSAWSWVAASILSLWSIMLMLFPRFLLFAAEEGQTLTGFESFLSVHFGILLAGVSAGLIIHIPSAHPVPRLEDTTPNHPLLVITTVTTSLSAFIAYNTPGLGGLPVLYSACTGTIGLWGLWAITFGNAGLISNKTGADKHTSSFIFGNKSSASAQKKAWKKDQKKRSI